MTMPNADHELRCLKEVLEIPAGREWESTVRLLLRLIG